MSTAVIDFGQTDCGAVQPAQTIVLANPSFTLLHYEAAFEHGTQYMVQPPSGFLLPGQELALSVSSAAIPASSEVTDDLYGDTLTITTDLDGDAPHVIDIRTIGIVAGVELASRDGAVGARAFETFLKCFDAGVMVRTTGDTLALSPPLIVEKAQIDQLVSTIATALRSVA